MKFIYKLFYIIENNYGKREICMLKFICIKINTFKNVNLFYIEFIF